LKLRHSFAVPVCAVRLRRLQAGTQRRIARPPEKKRMRDAKPVYPVLIALSLPEPENQPEKASS
jgi:hypothetical protein